MSKTIAVIGGGTAGLTAALGLVKAGYPVVLIEKRFLGGESTHTASVPSKALLYQARQVAELRDSLSFLDDVDAAQTSALLRKRAGHALEEVRRLRGQFRAGEGRRWLEQQGVGYIQARAVFTGKKSLALSELQYVSDWVAQEHPEVQQEGFFFFQRCIIASGSRPRIPGIFGLDKVPFYTNDNIFEIEQIPKHLLIVGNGQQGVEMASAFHSLGAQVTVIGQDKTMLQGKVDAEVAGHLQELMQQKGIRFEKGKVTALRRQEAQLKLSTEHGAVFSGSHVLLATGRLPNTQLQLEKAEVRYNSKGIHINKYSQTSTEHIFAIGDCCPVPRYTHFAYYQAKQLVANQAFRHLTKLPFRISSFRRRRIPVVVYADMEIAQYGYTEEKARKKWGEEIETHLLSFDAVDRAKLQDQEPGMIKVITRGPQARLIGVSILGHRAGEMLPEFQRLITNRDKLAALDSIIRAYPSYTSSLDKLYLNWLFKKLPPVHHEK